MVLKKILVTGGAGFIGSHLCASLLESGHQVICLDNLYTGTLQNIAALQANKNFSFVHHDVIHPFSFEVDEIYNLACPASPVHYQKDPVFTWKTSVFGMLNCLELAKKRRAKILQASTSEVYGDPSVHPQPEEYCGYVNPIGIRACYDEGKRASETLCFDFLRIFHIELRVARIFNTYGPNMHPEDGRVVSNFIMQALRGKDLTVYGKGLQTRSFCFVDDLVKGLIKLMESPSHIPGPINLGNPAEFTIMELAKKILDLTKAKSKIIFKPMPQDDPKQRKPDIAKAEKYLLWKPQISLDEGLLATIAYFEKVVKTCEVSLAL